MEPLTRPAGEPLGTRRQRPHHPDGWHTRDQLPNTQQGGGPRPPLADNLPKGQPR